jgi:DNA (cytosine-5)-methyltransferase 1
MAPMVADARGSAGVGKAELPNQAQQWPGPAARDFKGVNRDVPTPDYNARPLNEVAADFRPPSSQGPPIAGGSMSSTDGQNSNQPSVKRKLNPIFVEALMRWPTGLSGFERQETAWTRWWLLMPSFLSTLRSPPTPDQGSFL